MGTILFIWQIEILYEQYENRSTEMFERYYASNPSGNYKSMTK